MLNDCQGLAAKLLLPKTALNSPVPCVPFSWPTSKSPFSPFSMAAKSLLLPKPRGKKKSKTSSSSSFPSEPRGPFPHFRTSWFSSFTSEPHGPLPVPSEPRGSPPMAAGPRFKSQCPSSFAAPFPTPPTVSYTCQHPHILPALLGCHCKSGQVCPHGMEPIISTLSHRRCNQGELLPSYILGEVTPIPLAQSMATAI